MPRLQSNILKKSSVVVLLLAFCVVAPGQNPVPSGGHGIVVLKHSLKSARPGWDHQRAFGVGPADRSGRADPPVPLSAEAPPRLGYWYKARVENAGGRQVRAIVWDYQVVEKATQRVTSHRFRQTLKLKPGASKELRVFSYAPPSSVVSADSGGKKRREAFEEAVVIVRVEYADGSAWEMK
ncbi:MAG: hypothetical protein M3444_06320 [Acidobacteriota bacterium]|nr:hypothetical protein [Acidobacteriota bacterium]